MKPKKMEILNSLSVFVFIFISILSHARTQSDGDSFPSDLIVEADGLLARAADITANATCGVNGPEHYCRLVDHVQLSRNRSGEDVGSLQCDICDNTTESKSHRIRYVHVGDDNRWWQSPTLAEGLQYSNVDIVIDLKQVYQVIFVLLRMGDSPRPANWIMESSKDNVTYRPWIFFAETRYDCEHLYRVGYPDMKITSDDRPSQLGDDEVYCTTYYSQQHALRSGEIIISLILGRYSVVQSESLGYVATVSPKLIEFLSARFIRLRFQKMQTLSGEWMALPHQLEKTVFNRFYYSIRNIEVGGKCICNNHADKCSRKEVNGIYRSECECKHNTCGDNCELCCPMYNQQPWRPGRICQECNCNGKASACAYNQTVANLRLSRNKEGNPEGGGVCLNCQENTMGINCDQCKSGFYRPFNVAPISPNPCVPCNCDVVGSTTACISNDQFYPEKYPGDCICKPGYTGRQCEECATGYQRSSQQAGVCEPCPCDIRGSVPTSTYQCQPPCNCKVNVDKETRCRQCKPGYYFMSPDNPEGCYPCFCFGITNRCRSLDAGSFGVHNLHAWRLTTLDGRSETYPEMTREGYPRIETTKAELKLGIKQYYYWAAPTDFLGNLLTSYRSYLELVINVGRSGGDPAITMTDDPEIIVVGSTYRLAHTLRPEDRRLHRIIRVHLHESVWDLINDGPPRQPTQTEFLSTLTRITGFLVRAKYISDQTYVELRNVTLERGDPNAIGQLSHIERCECPPGYSGISCESCAPGYRRVDGKLYQGVCEKCQCHGHSDVCDPYTGFCVNCQHNTAGPYCDRCSDGFYGNSKSGDPTACQRCECPMPNYQLTGFCTTYEPMPGQIGYICQNCQNNTSGQRCHQCDSGYYGNPMLGSGTGGCRRCQCSGNEASCDNLDGVCYCGYNTVGDKCQYCRVGFYGTAKDGDCKRCKCSPQGSVTQICNRITGECQCREGYTGTFCDRCRDGRGNVTAGCPPCACHAVGTLNGMGNCNSTTGLCSCKPGVEQPLCDKCLPGFYGFSPDGCKVCNCSNRTLRSGGGICDPGTGQCPCGTNVDGRTCDRCKPDHYWTSPASPDCVDCRCGSGSLSPTCSPSSGQCACAPNVIGRACDKCKDNHFGLAPTGCKLCPVCSSGQVCHPLTGECICPPNTGGSLCEQCVNGAWNYSSTQGCQLCNCSSDGSQQGSNSPCDQRVGQCPCRLGYDGLLCDRCKDGFYLFVSDSGIANCIPCGCVETGIVPVEGAQVPISSPEQLNRTCAPLSGQCRCRANVQGRRCDQCKPGKFGLDPVYPPGCHDCFCSGLSKKCTQLKGYQAVPGPQFTVQIIDGPAGSGGSVIRSPPDYKPGSKFFWPFSRSRPGYYLVSQIKGDLSLLYGSPLLEVEVECVPDCGRKPGMKSPAEAILTSRGGSLVFAYDSPTTEFSPRQADTYRIDLDERHWRLVVFNGQPVDTPLVSKQITAKQSREFFMFVLINVTEIRIQLYNERAYPTSVSLSYSVYSAEKESSTSANRGVPITRVEECQCPTSSRGYHCQDPSPGYYRDEVTLPSWVNLDVLVNFTGISPRTNGGVINMATCQCNGHADLCHPNTGVCQGCTGNTMGPFCQFCAGGYYGNPVGGGLCKKCACPTEAANYSLSCTPSAYMTEYICNCTTGYSGNRCERCANGFYGNPLSLIHCRPCECNIQGSLDVKCNERGQCACAAGISGDKCDQCAEDYAVVNQTCQNCRKGCTQELYGRIDRMNSSLVRLNVSESTLGPLADLAMYSNKAVSLREKLVNGRRGVLNKLTGEVNDLRPEVNQRKMKVDQLTDQARVLRDRQCTAASTDSSLAEQAKRLNLRFVEWIAQMDAAKVTNTSVENLQGMVREAEEVLRQIQSKSFTSNVTATRELVAQLNNLLATLTNANQRAAAIRQSTSSMPGTLADLSSRLDGLRARIADLRQDVQRVNQNADELRSKISQANDTFAGLHVESFVNRTNQSLAADRKALEPVQVVIATKKSFELEIRNLLQLWIKLSGDLNKLGLDRMQLATLDSSYVTALEKEAATVVERLQQDLGKAAHARQAQDAYKIIVDAIDAAANSTKAADEAANNSSLQIDLEKWIQLAEQKAKITNETKEEAGRRARETEDASRNLQVEEKKFAEINTTGASILRTQEERKKKMDSIKTKAAAVNSNISSFGLKLTQLAEKQTNLSREIDTRQDKLRAVVPGQMAESRKNLMNTTVLETSNQRAHSTKTSVATRMEQLNRTVLHMEQRIFLIRQRIVNLRSNLAIIHGAAARSPVPIRLAKNCVRTYVTYHMVLTSVLQIDFWMRPAFSPKLNSPQNLIMFGYRQYPERVVSFAITLEGDGKVKFIWHTGSTQYSIAAGRLTDQFWYRVKVFGSLGVTNITVDQYPLTPHPETQPPLNSFTDSKSNDDIENRLLLDHATRLQLGGPLPESPGPLGESLRTSAVSYEGCLFGLQLMERAVGLDEFMTVSTGCDPNNQEQQPFGTSFNCKIHIRYSDSFVNKRDLVPPTQRVLGPVQGGGGSSGQPVPRPRLSNLFKYDIFDFHGPGYLRVNFSATMDCSKIFSVRLLLRPLESMKIDRYFNVFAIHDPVAKRGMAVQLFNGRLVASVWNQSTAYSRMDLITDEHSSALITLYWEVSKQIFKSGGQGNESQKILGSDLLCSPNAVFYLGGVSLDDVELTSKLTALTFNNFNFLGRLGIAVRISSLVKEKYFFQHMKHGIQMVGQTRFVNRVSFNDIEAVHKWKPRWLCYKPSESSSGVTLDLGEVPQSFWKHPISFTVDLGDRFPASELTLLSTSGNTALSLRLTPRGILRLVRSDADLLQLQLDSPGAHIIVLKIGTDWKTVHLMVGFNMQSAVLVTSLTENLTPTPLLFGPAGSLAYPVCIYDVVMKGKFIDFESYRVSGSVLPPNVYFDSCRVRLFPGDILHREVLVSTKTDNPQAIVSARGVDAAADAVSEDDDSTAARTAAKARRHVNKRCQAPPRYPEGSVWFSGQAASPAWDLNDLSSSAQHRCNNFTLRFRTVDSRRLTLAVIVFSDGTSVGIRLNQMMILLDPNDESKGKGIVVPFVVANDQWHQIQIASLDCNEKQKLPGALVSVDGRELRIPGEVINFIRPLRIYVGASPQGSSDSYQPFHGCIHDVHLNNHWFQPPSTLQNCFSCFTMVHDMVYTPMKYRSEIAQRPVQLQDSPVDFINSTILKFSVRFTGKEEGVIFTMGYKTPLDSLAAIYIRNGKVYFGHGDKQRTNRHSNEGGLDLVMGQWTNLEFIVVKWDDASFYFTLRISQLQRSAYSEHSGMIIFSPNPRKINFFLGGYASWSGADIGFVIDGTYNPFNGCLKGIEVGVNSEKTTATRFVDSPLYLTGICPVDIGTERI